MFALKTTNIGMNLAIFVPALGRTSLDAVIDVASAEVAAQNGNQLRLVQVESNNYWYAIPPLTWFFTPLVTSVTLEYRPSVPEAANAAANRPQPN